MNIKLNSQTIKEEEYLSDKRGRMVALEFVVLGQAKLIFSFASRDRVCPNRGGSTTGSYVAILVLSPGQHNLAVSIFHFP